MDFLVVGCGSIGQRHIKNLQSLGYNVFGCDTDIGRLDEVGNRYGITVFRGLEKALTRKYDAVFICSPTRFHISQAIKVARKKIHLFIEKPLSDDLKGVKELSRIAKHNKLVVLVACNTRFFPSFQLAKKLIDNNAIGKVLSLRVQCGFYLPFWHPYEDYRKGYSANKKLGGGVILDDIHEIDSLYWLFGKPKELFCFAGKVSSLAIDTEDLAEIAIRFKTRLVAQIHLDYLQRTYRRHYEFIGEKGIIVWDYIKQTVELFGKEVNQRSIFQENINTDRETMFINEVKHFINCIKGKEVSINDLDSAEDVLKIALACKESAQKMKVVRL